jgi:radical SAM superfamily enzyme YgiQ (UPF0313 family)
MAKILLCHPLFLTQNLDEQEAKSPYFPLGLLYLAGYVRQQNHDVVVFDGTFAKGEIEFVESLKTQAPDAVGISALLPTRQTALRLAQLAHDFGAVVLIGGPDPTRDPQAYLTHQQVDAVVHHEGEQTLVRLLDLLDTDRLTAASLHQELGVAFRNDAGLVIVKPPRPPIDNLDTLPLPARDLIDTERYLQSWRDLNGYSSLTITTARGCPYGCEWCRDSVHGQGYRQRSPENVVSEVKALMEEYDIDRLRVIDDVDGMSRQWINSWVRAAESMNAVIPFEALNDLERQDIPMLGVRDTL